MESAEARYEFTTARIVLLVFAMVVWLLLAVAAVGQSSDKSTSYQVGAFIGALGISLLVSWIVRSIYRAIRRRPIGSPGWTPGLFWGAAFVSLLSLAGNAG